MTYEEKNAWIYAALAIVIPVTYFGSILPRLGNTAATEIAYQQPLLIAIGAAIVSAIVLSIVLGIFSPKTAGKKDQRDKDINRLGEYVAGIILGVGFILPFGLALIEADHFWIANAIYLVFVLSAFCGTTVKLVAYRRGF